MTRHIAAVLASALLVVPACFANDDSDPDEVAVAESASTAAEGAADSAYLMTYFRLDADTEADALAGVAASIEADVTVPSCLTVDTDGLTYLDLTFDQCMGMTDRVVLDGKLYATVSISRDSITYQVTTTDFSINATTVSGQWTLQRMLMDAAPWSWTGMTAIEGPRRSVQLSSSATFTWDGSCLALDFNGMVDRGQSLSVDDFQRCVGQCPISGDVTIDYAVGAALSWSYNGDGTATINTRRGKTFDIALPCSY